MDWPGAQEMAKRFAKTIDPKLMDTDNKDPALQAAEQQMQAMAQEMENMHKMLQNVSKSIEMKDVEVKEFEATIKAFDAETKRLTAVQASMSPEQIQDIVLGTVHGMITSGDLISEMPMRGQGEMQEDQGMGQPPMDQGMQQPPPEQGMMQPPQQPEQPPQGMPPQ
jgi:predicted transcriptional regulator